MLVQHLLQLGRVHIISGGDDHSFDTLDEAGIAYFGAGHDLEEAMKPVYMDIDGKTVAFVAASRAEKNKMTPEATETTPGIL